MDTPWRGARSASAHARSGAMSRTFKEMRAVCDRKRGAVLSRQQARRCAQLSRTLSDRYERRGRREEELPSSDRTEKEDVK
jgi:hypothetical protein